MQRNIILALAVVILLLAAALAFVLLRGQPNPGRISINAADENAIEPYHREMSCIDQVMQNNDLNANEVEPALDRCKGEAFGNQSQGQ
jgi:hypothetical protein